MISGSWAIRMYKLESLTLYLSCECLRMCFYTSCFFCKYGISSQNDYHSKYRLGILCREPVWMLRYLFPRPGILVISWKYRTLVWMSTRRIKPAKCNIFKYILSVGRVQNCEMRIVNQSQRVFIADQGVNRFKVEVELHVGGLGFGSVRPFRFEPLQTGQVMD